MLSNCKCAFVDSLICAVSVLLERKEVEGGNLWREGGRRREREREREREGEGERANHVCVHSRCLMYIGHNIKAHT